jgi:lipoic acid synthetase
MQNLKENKLPKVRLPSDTEKYGELVNIIEKENLNTVCQEADCPNIYNCFSKGTLTFMILGNICTRNCSYCNVKTGEPLSPDRNEPKRIANVIKRLKLKYIVITCVTRDDLDDGGVALFAETVEEIKGVSPVRSNHVPCWDALGRGLRGTSNGVNPDCKVELLISDLNGNWEALKTITDAKPEVIGHNIEVARELFPKVRPQGNYERSIELLKNLKKYDSSLITKSGIMVGLGETHEQIIQTMEDIRSTDCDIMTIGQYLAPSSKHTPVEKFYSMEEFSFLKEVGESLAFRCIESGPLVRSSFNAYESYKKAKNKICLT